MPITPLYISHIFEEKNLNYTGTASLCLFASFPWILKQWKMKSSGSNQQILPFVCTAVGIFEVPLKVSHLPGAHKDVAKLGVVRAEGMLAWGGRLGGGKEQLPHVL